MIVNTLIGTLIFFKFIILLFAAAIISGVFFAIMFKTVMFLI